MNPKAAIQELKFKFYYDCNNPLFLASVAALEKQIPKKPLNTKDKAGICPTCGNYICFAWHESACGDCGQAIDWSEVK